MTPSKKSDARVSKPKQTPRKRDGTMPIVLIAAGVVVLIIMAVLLIEGSGKKPAAPTQSKAAVDTMFGAGVPSPRKSPARVSALSKAKRDTTKRKVEQRAKPRSATATGGARTIRSSSGGYVHAGEAQGASNANQLSAILTDATGSRTALVGSQRLKAGDDVAGHRILDVETDAVKVQFHDNTYTVKIGEKVY